MIRYAPPKDGKSALLGSINGREGFADGLQKPNLREYSIEAPAAKTVSLPQVLSLFS